MFKFIKKLIAKFKGEDYIPSDAAEATDEELQAVFDEVYGKKEPPKPKPRRHFQKDLHGTVKLYREPIRTTYTKQKITLVMGKDIKRDEYGNITISSNIFEKKEDK